MSTSTVIPIEEPKEIEELDGKAKLRNWLNMNFRIKMTDGRVLIGVFLCTDRDANVILDNIKNKLPNNMYKEEVIVHVILMLSGACSEYLKTVNGEKEEPRVLGLVMVPGRHIVSIQIDDTSTSKKISNDDQTST